MQRLAEGTGRDLVVQNLSLQTDGADLLGGFRPVELRQLAQVRTGLTKGRPGLEVCVIGDIFARQIGLAEPVRGWTWPQNTRLLVWLSLVVQTSF